MPKAIEAPATIDPRSAVLPPFDRTEMSGRQIESWRPPTFTGSGQSWAAWTRRLLDLQARSIWHDLSSQLPHVRGKMLDVGCGAQPYRCLLDSSVEYLGIDTSDARDHFGYEVPDTTYFDGNTWPVKDAWADFMLCTEVLEHVSHPREFLAEAARCLRPGGRILLTVPFSARWHYIPHDYWRYSPSCLKMLLEEAGFDFIGVYSRGNELTVSCYKTMAMLLPVILPQGHGLLLTWLFHLLAIPLIPCLCLLAVVGNLSLLGKGGDDCLGFTVTAARKAAV